MKLFGWTICKTKEYDEIMDNVSEIRMILNKKLIKDAYVYSELKRLKQDHWDKDAFDKLMNVVKEMD